MPTLRIHLLGDFLLRLGDSVVTTINTPRLQALLAYLVLHRGAPQPRRQLAFLLWPDSSERQARTNLRNLVHLLRHALPEADRFLQIDGPMLQWRVDASWTLDVADFEQALAQAEQPGDIASLRAALDRAAGLYRGDLLPSCYDDWIVPERERLRLRLLEALERIIQILEAERAYPAAIRYAQRLLRHDPLHEATYQHLIHLHALSGDRAGALRVYQTCVAVLKRELGIAPGAETRAAYERLARADASALPPSDAVSPPDSPSHNLPALLTSFVGRSRELAEVTRLLAGARLLTLTGAGGCGKTRLALAAATELAATFQGGVWLAELAALTDPALVPQSVAAALRVREEAQRPLTATLVDVLRSKELLLLLDNCEHLIAAAADLVQTLLNACPRLHILATSREALGISGETTWLIPSLALPDSQPAAGEPELAAILLRSEAVQLFVERAAAVLPTFLLTNANAPAVAQICRRLDGIPLALELAAARVKVITITQLAARLDDCFRLLADGSRTALPRHQTLRAAIDWSYDLLPAQEQCLLERLAVFAGGWTLTDAEAVCAGASIAAEDVLGLLAHLVDKSLIVVDTQPEREARYRLQEIIQQYAQDRLEAHGVAAAIQRRHADYYLALAETADLEITGTQQVAWLERLEAEHDNLRAALRWTIEGQVTEVAIRISAALWRFWWMHGHMTEGRRWLDQVLAYVPDMAAAPGGAQPWAKAFQGAGVLADEQGDSERALVFYERCLALRRTLGDQAGIAAVLNSMGVGAYYQGMYERTGVLLEESLLLRRQLGDKRRIAVVLNNLGLVALDQGNLAQAQVLFAESLALDRETGNLSGIAIALNNLGTVAREQRDYAQALTLFQQGLRRCQELSFSDGITECLEGLADIAGAAGQAERAALMLGVVEEMRAAIHLSLSHGEQIRCARTVAAVREQLDAATFASTWAAGRALRLEQAIGEAQRLIVALAATPETPSSA